VGKGGDVGKTGPALGQIDPPGDMSEVPLWVNCRRQPELLVNWELWEHPT
jgi:hypothetical protein